MQLGREAGRTRRAIKYLHSPADFWITHYGESYNGYKLGCGNGVYASINPTIVAVGLEWEAEWPCGMLLEVCGPGGCQVVSRQDGCPGCGDYVLDLSEAGIARVCGQGTGVCRATVQQWPSVRGTRNRTLDRPPRRCPGPKRMLKTWGNCFSTRRQGA